jgi:molybdopterin-guanine dinucleotide biosynthesis protein A
MMNTEPSIENRKSKIENRLTVAIMAGGKSRRMGRDKAFVEIDGVPMLERVVRAALGTGLPVMVVGRERPDVWRYDDVRFVVDRIPDRGPLGGLATALEACGTDVLALACDMPYLTTEAIGWLVDAASATPLGDGAVAVNKQIVEPMFGVYRASVIAKVGLALNKCDYSVKRLIGAGEFARCMLPPRYMASVESINTIEELATKAKWQAPG